MKDALFHTIIIGSGASGLNCALQLIRNGIKPENISIFTENIGSGTSFNTGSDKQTYYKLSMVGDQADSPVSMAHALYDGGCMHGDIAFVEANCSIRSFMNLVNLGVPFPHDQYGGWVGYKTDNDDFQRGTSAGPLTSQYMSNALLNELRKYDIVIKEKTRVIDIIKDKSGVASGIVYLDMNGFNPDEDLLDVDFEQLIKSAFAEYVVLATGGPSCIYANSVYPKSQWGAMSLAIFSGAKLQNLTESQYGLASTKFRWNVSGTYQQVIPRYISVDSDIDPALSESEPREFLREYFPDARSLVSATFLKGYQWPFNADRIADYGSSLIDMAVHIETVVKKRRVYMDFLHNPRDFTFEKLNQEAYNYLKNSDGLLELPISRLERMNPAAIRLYIDHDIDLRCEPLEIAVCAQHCNGGITGDLWWQTSVPRLFAIGEVNGSHGIHRPGGAALNSGQVGSLRAAQKIAHMKGRSYEDIQKPRVLDQCRFQWISLFQAQLESRSNTENTMESLIQRIQNRMMHCGAYIRKRTAVKKALQNAQQDLMNFSDDISMSKVRDLKKFAEVLDALVTQTAFLYSIEAYMEASGGSRGSYMIIDDSRPQDGVVVHPALSDYPIINANPELNNRILEIRCENPSLRAILNHGLKMSSNWVDKRPIPSGKPWFENVWKKYTNGDIFKDGGF